MDTARSRCINMMVLCYQSDAMPKTLTVRIDEATYRLIEEAAEADNRSVSNFIETAAREKALAEIFVSEGEMAEIRADKALKRRLETGHKDAAARRGRFV
jgi:uncharacterized protein (DUF1778 family)